MQTLIDLDFKYGAELPSLWVPLSDDYMISISRLVFMNNIESLLLVNDLQIDFLFIVEELILEGCVLMNNVSQVISLGVSNPYLIQCQRWLTRMHFIVLV
jgi:hypothetical protein